MLNSPIINLYERAKRMCSKLVKNEKQILFKPCSGRNGNTVYGLRTKG
jgi:hypothetical protein